MQVYVARQAILNRRQNVVGYELLFRDSPKNVFPNVPSHEATSKLIVNTQLNGGLDSITNGMPALLNFSQECLIKRLPMLLPPKKATIEILETVQPTDEVYECCEELYKAGYSLALDDFVYSPAWARFLKFVKLVKFDLFKTPLSSLHSVLHEIRKNKHIRVLAEKVETRAEFEMAKEMGFDFFQGFFFFEPEMHKGKDVQSNYFVMMQIYRELCRPNINMDKLTRYFQQDVYITYKLLRYINSALVPTRAVIKSIKQALVYLGEKETRKLLMLLTTAHASGKKPKELTRIAIIRAHFCEGLAKSCAKGREDEAFMMGVVSLLDVILGADQDEILDSLPITDDIKGALSSDEDSTFHHMIEVVRAYETGQWHLISDHCEALEISQDSVAKCYKAALEWESNFQAEINK